MGGVVEVSLHGGGGGGGGESKQLKYTLTKHTQYLPQCWTSSESQGWPAYPDSWGVECTETLAAMSIDRTPTTDSEHLIHTSTETAVHITAYLKV